MATGTFHLQMSADGGANWQNVAIPSDLQSVQNWFVNAAGQVYVSPTLAFTIQPTVIAGTVVPSTPVPLPTITPQSGIPGASPAGADVSRPSQMYRPTSLEIVHDQANQFAPSQSIRRYDPKSNSWSTVTNPPTRGYMLQITSVQSNSGAVLWFVGMAENGQVLFRYIA